MRRPLNRILKKFGYEIVKRSRFYDLLEKMRREGILLGFLAAASLLVAAATAWWAAVAGGNHRDQGTIWEGLARNQKLWAWQETIVAKRRT